jgi:hypothetical protein
MFDIHATIYVGCWLYILKYHFGSYFTKNTYLNTLCKNQFLTRRGTYVHTTCQIYLKNWGWLVELPVPCPHSQSHKQYFRTGRAPEDENFGKSHSRRVFPPVVTIFSYLATREATKLTLASPRSAPCPFSPTAAATISLLSILPFRPVSSASTRATLR